MIKTLDINGGKVFINVCLHSSVSMNQIVCVGDIFPNRQLVGTKSEGVAYDVVVNELEITHKEGDNGVFIFHILNH